MKCTQFLIPFLLLLGAVSGTQADTGIKTKEQLSAYVNSFITAVRPFLVQQQMEVEIVNVLWEDPILQAGVRIVPEDARNRSLEMQITGGLVRHKNLTRDTLNLMLCHELGHAVGGAPKTTRKMGSKKRTEKFAIYKDGTFEGQADYFAAAKCFRYLHEKMDNTVYTSLLENKYKVKISPTLKTKCAAVWHKPNDIALCIRTGLAALNMTTVLEEERIKNFAAKKEAYTPVLPSLEKEDKVPSSLRSHPNAQCRLDTLIQGALCKVPASVKPSDVDPNVGYCIDGAPGARPSCWFQAEFYPSAWTHPKSTKDSQWNGVGTLDNSCSASLIDLGGNENSQALIATNGHCLKDNRLPEQFILGLFFDAAEKDQVSIAIDSVVFSTMKNSDVAVLKLKATVAELKKQGFHFYQLAKSPTEKTPVTSVGIPQKNIVSSSRRLVIGQCAINKAVTIKEDLWQWQSLQTGCSNTPGMSGSPLFDKESGKIIGLLNTMPDENSSSADCGLDKPCQLQNDGSYKVFPMVTYAQKTDLILQCVTASGALNAQIPDCQGSVQAPK